jgi:hypothetical protein
MQVTEWKNAMTTGASGVFGPGRAQAETEDFECQRDELHAKMGRLTIEVGYLREKSKQLGL